MVGEEVGLGFGLLVLRVLVCATCSRLHWRLRGYLAPGEVELGFESLVLEVLVCASCERSCWRLQGCLGTGGSELVFEIGF